MCWQQQLRPPPARCTCTALLQGDIGYAFYKRPYADWTGADPVNTAYDLNDPLKWQPLVETNGRGYFQVQQLVTPQAARVDPVLASASYFRSSSSRAPAPYPVSLRSGCRRQP